jgi:hypothetical protein
MAMMNRSALDASAALAFTAIEIGLLDKLVVDKLDSNAGNRSRSIYLTKLARLGGYLARSSDPPPGNMAVWRGLSRLTNIHLGFLLATQDVGNRKLVWTNPYVMVT